ncbi:MAG: tRNA (adenosine(37)-N6)-threonylcarbamoyltransferase complex dimerization subunit type 1 TsaB [Smithella sp.]|nr:tRNA (adenosine(37)-N6)-threonylcarbamoyltransferase complex dimerization subunit type 1 TsaB [Smithella sp.]
MLILAFDTSSKTASVAVLQDNTVLYESLINIGLNHSEVLLPGIEQACLRTGIKISEFDLFACTIGPGSFTGLRIGASTMKGFMLATGKPAVGISSLAALACNAGMHSTLIYPVMDAGRGQVYTACFQFDQNGIPEQVEQESIMNPGDIQYDRHQKMIILGDGVVKYRDVFPAMTGKNITILPSSHQYIRASSVCFLGREKYERKELLDADTFVPLYLRSPDAELKK